MMDFSVTMGVYKNDNVEHFRIALESVLNQTVPPTEIVITQDGPVPVSMTALLNEYTQKYTQIHLLVLLENKGLGIAHQIGVDNCQYDWVAIMDADDICAPNRFELQTRYLDEHPEVDVLGGQIAEFIGNETNIVGKRIVPLSDSAIKTYMKKRSAMNHMTMIMRRKAILNAGNYQDWHFNEDYYLWCRMMVNGIVFANLPEVLVNVRVGAEMYQRRGGWRYFKSEARLQRFMRQNNLIAWPRYCFNVLVRFVVQVLMTNSVRSFVFQKLFRK